MLSECGVCARECAHVRKCVGMCESVGLGVRACVRTSEIVLCLCESVHETACAFVTVYDCVCVRVRTHVSLPQLWPGPLSRGHECHQS